MASTSNGRRGYWRYIQVAGGVEALLFDASGETIISKNPRRHFLDGVEFYPGEWRALLAEVYNEDCRRGNEHRVSTFVVSGQMGVALVLDGVINPSALQASGRRRCGLFCKAIVIEKGEGFNLRAGGAEMPFKLEIHSNNVRHPHAATYDARGKPVE